MARNREKDEGGLWKGVGRDGKGVGMNEKRVATGRAEEKG